MADLLDIAPSTSVEVVKIDGKRIIVHGLHGNAVASLVGRFPGLVLLISGDGDIGAKLIAQVGQAIGPVIAAGCGHLGDEKYEEAAGKLLLEDQLKLLRPIIALSFPNGFTAFVEAITAMLPGAGAGEKPVKMRLRKSPSPSPTSSAGASRPTMQ